MTPIVSDYLKYLRRIQRTKSATTKAKNVRLALQALTVMTPKAANEAMSEVARQGLKEAQAKLLA